MALVVLLLGGRMAELEGRLDDEGRRMLVALERELGIAPEAPQLDA